MPKELQESQATIFGSPFRVRAHKVGKKQFRIRVSTSIWAGAKWLTKRVGEATPAVATIGPFGGVVLSPKEGEIKKIDRLIGKTLQKHPVTIHDVAADWVKLARFAASMWEVRIRCENRSKYSITMPEMTRNLGIFPQDEQHLVVFPAGGVIEIWPAAEWVAQMRQHAGVLTKVSASASEEIQDESGD